MVCVPCFIVPVLLYLWHKFVQPILLRYWNPWEKKDKDGNVIKPDPKSFFDCSDGVCRFAGKKSAPAADPPSSVEPRAEPGKTVSTGPDDEAKKSI